MDPLIRWTEISKKNRALRFLDIILKGYGQVLICLNPVTGLTLVATILYFSGAICLLTLLGALSSTLTAYVIRARPLHINSGVYGFNGVVLGIAWPWFLKMETASIVLFIFAASLSSVLIKAGIDINSRTRTNLPVFSIPAVVITWLVVVLLRSFFFHAYLIGPNQRVIDYLQIYSFNFDTLSDHFTLDMFFHVFHKQIIGAAVIFFGIWAHSRISAMFCVITLAVTGVVAYSLGGRAEFLTFDFYLYNAVPCGLALGGIFLVFNRKTLLLTILAIAAVNWSTYAGMRYFPLPLFVAPFNFLTILFIWLVKSNILKREDGFYAVPMDLVSTPEFGLEWYKGELYAANYWQRIDPSAAPSHDPQVGDASTAQGQSRASSDL